MCPLHRPFQIFVGSYLRYVGTSHLGHLTLDFRLVVIELYVFVAIVFVLLPQPGACILEFNMLATEVVLKLFKLLRLVL